MHGCPVAVCGGLASDPVAAPVLLGLGVSELSVVPTLIPQLKSLIRGLTLDACRALAQRALVARDGGAGARAGARGDSMKKLIAKLQPIGRALMLPIAVLPVAALLLRLGQPDLLNMPAIAAAGDAIFSNLGLLFAHRRGGRPRARESWRRGPCRRGGLPGGDPGRQGAHRRAARDHRQHSRAVQGAGGGGVPRQGALQAQRSGGPAVGPDRRMGVQPLQRNPPA